MKAAREYVGTILRRCVFAAIIITIYKVSDNYGRKKTFIRMSEQKLHSEKLSETWSVRTLNKVI